MTPWLLLGSVLVAVGAFFYGQEVGGDRAIAEQKRTQDIVRETQDLAQKGAANVIADMEIKHVEITQPIRTEIRTRTVYADCKHTPDGLRSLNSAITGRADSTGDRKLP